MRVTYDESVDAAYIYLTEIGCGEAQITTPVNNDINLDFDKDGRLLGIEVLNARNRLPVEVLNQADRA